ncbi:hypothetical protein C7999DRAFT_13443 [Corynascus novoguineensis]|uniref:NmrA-like domain-containing protein n=1 Tax=Corynascus novoguineensis TaxID=1126955 RepID=A0AAN7CVF5_9PEZI|nr:hypothetical protein C7999DRAFT_13443 [Corynascus novoguineensis]
MDRTILVTGATGKQGGAVIKALLDTRAGFHILAVTRDRNSPSAKRLAAKSSDVTLVQGNLDDTEVIFENAKQATSHPIWGVFSVQLPAFNKDGPAIEERQGKALVDSAIKHGVKHFVYTSVDRHGESSINNPTNVPHFRSKHNIEHHLIAKAQGTAMTWTILRPVGFMENFDPGFLGKVFASSWRLAIKSRPLQLVATDDIGVFAAMAFAQVDRFKAQSISLAGDELTYDQMVDVFRRKTGSAPPLTWSLVARLVLWLSEEMGTMFAFFEKEGYGADISELKKMHPRLKDLGTWLDENNRKSN